MGLSSSKGSSEDREEFEQTIIEDVEEHIVKTPVKEIEVMGYTVLIIHHNGKFYAVGSRCPFGNEPLADGVVFDGHIRCPQHGARFHLDSGDVTDLPAMDCIHSYEVRLDDNKLLMKASKKTLSESVRVKRSLRLFPSDKRTIVIIGAGAAGMVCAETLRQEGFYGRLWVLSKDEHLPYDRTRLSKTADVDVETLRLREKQFWTSRDIQIKNEKEVASVDFNHNRILLKDGEEVLYYRLIIATGAKAKKLTMVRDYDLPGIFTLRTFNEAKLITQKSRGQSVVIVGASFLGMELAGTLVGIAQSVSVVDKTESPLFHSLGKEVGNALRTRLEAVGVKFHLGRRVKQFVGEEKLNFVHLDDDTSIGADLCVVAVGVLPDTNLFKETGILMTSQDFIIVNKQMKTSKKDVFAAGDCTACHLLDGNPNEEDTVVVQHWQWAQQQGRTAALNIMDKGIDMNSVPFYWTVIADKHIRITGFLEGHETVVIDGNVEEADFVAYYIKNGHVTAVASCNRDPVTSQMAELLLSGKQISIDELRRDPHQWTQYLNPVPCTHF